MKLKRVILPLLTLGTITTPIVAVVSCSKRKTLSEQAQDTIQAHLASGWTMETCYMDSEKTYTGSNAAMIGMMHGAAIGSIHHAAGGGRTGSMVSGSLMGAMVATSMANARDYYAHITWKLPNGKTFVENIEVSNENFQQYLANVLAQQGQSKHGE